MIEISRSFQKFGLSFVVTQILTSMIWISADMWLLWKKAWPKVCT